MTYSCYTFGDVNVAVRALDGPADLCPAQQKQLDDIALPKRRAERAVVYDLINRYVSRGALITHDASGVPSLVSSDGAAQPYLSISHSHDYAAIAWRPSGAPIGIDIEQPTPRLRSIAERYLTDDDIAVVGDHDEALLRAWTIKEAVYKAALTPGLALNDIHIQSVNAPFTRVSLSPTPADTASGAATRAFTCYTRSDADATLTLAIEDTL